MARRGFGDETWRLAAAGDAAGLRRAAEALAGLDDGLYDSRRPVAFGLALRGRTHEALSELNAGWSDDWPPPSAFALDVARIHFLTGDGDRTLSAIELELRGVARWDGVGELVVAAVRLEPHLWLRGLRLVVTAERGARKLGAVGAVLAARLGRRGQSGPRLPAATPES